MNGSESEWESGIEDETVGLELADESDELSWEDEALEDEAIEMELAAQLLEVSTEEELDQFLGSLINRVKSAAGNFIRSPTGQFLGSQLRKAARQALPNVARRVGSFLGGAQGARSAVALANAAARKFNLEVEGLSPEDQQYEVARRFVRFARTAVKRAAAAPPAVSPVAAARQATLHAARQHAPGLVTSVSAGASSSPGGPATSGRWIRRGRRIVLLDV